MTAFNTASATVLATPRSSDLAAAKKKVEGLETRIGALEPQVGRIKELMELRDLALQMQDEKELGVYQPQLDAARASAPGWEDLLKLRSELVQARAVLARLEAAQSAATVGMTHKPFEGLWAAFPRQASRAA